MSPLPQSNTQRWFYTYQQGTVEHELVVRGTSVATLAEADILVENLFTAIGGELITGTFTKVEHAAAGSDIRFPVTSARQGDTFGTGTPTGYHTATYMGFTGKGTDGRRARMFVFGFKNALGNYRLLSSASTAVAAAVSALNAATTVGVTISGTETRWNEYANLGVNDHWEVKARQG